MKFGFSIFNRGFNSSKCKKMAKMAVARIKLLRKKRQLVVKQMRRDIALLLQSGQDATARIRVEHVIREQNIMAANEFIELFCELVAARLSVIAKQRECPADLKEGISSLIFAALWCSDIPELLAIQNIFEKKYGKDFISAATDPQPSSGVNRMLIEKLCVTPTGEVKLRIMKEIAKEYQIEWDTTESELELLKPTEELIEGPHAFVSATSLPVKDTQKQIERDTTDSELEPLKPAEELLGGPHVFVSAISSIPVKDTLKQPVETNEPTTRYSESKGREDTMHFKDMASADEAAAESAKKAIAAAQAAACLASEDSNQITKASGFIIDMNGLRIKHEMETLYGHSTGIFTLKDALGDSQTTDDQSHYLSDEETMPTSTDVGKVYRRHSYNAPSVHSDIKFDESDCDEEIDMDEPTGGINVSPNRSINMDGSESFKRSHYGSDEETNPTTRDFEKVYQRDSYDEEIDMEESTGGVNVPPNQPANMDFGKFNRRHSYNDPSAHSDMKFDESDCDEEIDMEEPTNGIANLPAQEIASINVKQGLVPRIQVLLYACYSIIQITGIAISLHMYWL